MNSLNGGLNGICHDIPLMGYIMNSLNGTPGYVQEPKTIHSPHPGEHILISTQSGCAQCDVLHPRMNVLRAKIWEYAHKFIPAALAGKVENSRWNVKLDIFFDENLIMKIFYYYIFCSLQPMSDTFLRVWRIQILVCCTASRSRSIMMLLHKTRRSLPGWRWFGEL